jgi:hypothetical protein
VLPDVLYICVLAELMERSNNPNRAPAVKVSVDGKIFSHECLPQTKAVQRLLPAHISSHENIKMLHNFAGPNAGISQALECLFLENAPLGEIDEAHLAKAESLCAQRQLLINIERAINVSPPSPPLQPTTTTRLSKAPHTCTMVIVLNGIQPKPRILATIMNTMFIKRKRRTDQRRKKPLTKRHVSAEWNSRYSTTRTLNYRKNLMVSRIKI